MWSDALRHHPIKTSSLPAPESERTNRLTWEELVRLYRLTLDQPAQNTQARYNVCPTDPIPTIVRAKSEHFKPVSLQHLLRSKANPGWHDRDKAST